MSKNETTETFQILTSGAVHERTTLAEAQELAESLRRYGWVEIIHHFTDADGEPSWKVVMELEEL